MWLGGDDFDYEIMKYINEKYEQCNPKDNKRFQGILKREVEKAKIALSTAYKTRIIINDILKDSGGNTVNVKEEITREQFNNMILHYVRKSLSLTEKAILK